MENIKKEDQIDYVNNPTTLLNVIINKGKEAELDFLYVNFMARKFVVPVATNGYDNATDGYGNLDHLICEKSYVINFISQPMMQLTQQDYGRTIQKLNSLIHKEDMPWINSKDIRLAKFIEYTINNNKITQNIITKFKTKNKWNIDWHRGFILQLNLANASKTHKINLVEKIKKLWQETKIFDQKLRWYNSDTKKKIDVSWKWFSKKHPALIMDVETPREKLEIYSIFDRLLTDNTLKENYLTSIKTSNRNSKGYDKAKNKPLKLDSKKLPPIKKLLKMEAEQLDISQQKLIEILFIHALNNNQLSAETIEFIKNNTIIEIDATYGKEMRKFSFLAKDQFGKK